MSLSYLRVAIAVVAGLLFALASAAAEPTREEIERAVKQLGDDDFAVRQKASKLLWEAGPAAEAALEEAVKDPDAEVVVRAAAILDKFRWGLYPDTPADVADLIKAYRTAGDNPAREASLRGLLGKGTKGIRAVRKIAAAEGNKDVQAFVKTLLTREAAVAVPALVAEDMYDDVEELLSAIAASRDRRALQDYVACLILRDRVEAKIKQLEPNAGDAATAQLLAYLYRAKGDLPKALAHARKSGDEPLVDTLLFLSRDWGGLLERLSSRPGAPPGLLLTCQLRTGKKEDAAKTIKLLKDEAQKKPAGEGTVWWNAKPLFINGLPDEALPILEHGHSYPIMFDTLAVRMRFGEAQGLADKLREKKEKGWLGVGVRQVRILRELGEKKKADALLDELARATDTPADDWERREVIGLLYETGRRDQAFEALADRLTKNPQTALDAALWPAVFPKDRGRQVMVWWAYFRGTGAFANPTDTLKGVREVMEGKGERKALAEKLAAALKWTRPANGQQRPYEAALALSEWCAEMKLREEERQCIVAETEATGSPLAWQRLGEHDAADKKWKEAAESFRTAWEKSRTQPAPLWLWGWAVEQGGDAKEGARLMQRARWVALGNEVSRYGLSRVMVQKGRPEDVRRESAMNERLAMLDSWYLGEALYASFAAAEEAKDYAKAAEALDLGVLRVMVGNTYYLDYRSWVTQPGGVHFQRARALLTTGKVDDGLEEAAACLALLPGDTNVVIQTVPILEKLGRVKEADALFEKATAPYDAVLRDHPDWALGLNNLAWLSLRCHRKIDEALAHAKRAVELEPERTVYLDTLAEAHFQHGDRERAVELMKKCVEREPEREFYKAQLKRYEAGDPKAEVPDVR